MALVKTTFLGSTQAENAPEVLTWLQNNATGLFDTIEADANGNISCNIGNTTAIRIGFDGSTTTKYTLANNKSEETIDTNIIFSSAIKTTKGIRLIGNIYDIFVSKSDVGTTCFASIFRTAPDYDYAYFFADFVHSPNFYNPIVNSYQNVRNGYTRQAPNTSLTHCIFDGGFYAPDLYIATFSQYALTSCNFSIENKKYTTDGVIVLAE